MAIRAGIGISEEKDITLAAQEAVRQARLAIGGQRPDLALIFGTSEFLHPSTIALIKESLGDCPVVGCSSLILIAGGRALKYGLIILAMSLGADTYFNCGCVKEINAHSPASAGAQLGEKLLYGFKNIRRDLSIIFSDGKLRDASGFLWGLQEKLGRSFPLSGACASGNTGNAETKQCYEDEVFSEGACGVLLGGKVSFGLSIKHGWKPLGKPRYVTRSEGNIVYEIDGVPGAQIYKDYFAAGQEKLKNELRRISTLYPVGIFIPGEKEYLLRNILSVEDSGALVFQGSIPQSSMIRLMIGTKESCLEAARRAAEEAKSGLAGKPSDFVLVFNSLSRYILLGRQADKEIETVSGTFGAGVPVIGIYTEGELAPLKAVDYQGRAYFHNQSIEILAVGG